MRGRPTRLLASMVALAMMAAACGGDDDGSAADATTPSEASDPVDPDEAETDDADDDASDLSPKDVVVAATTELFADGDLTAIDRWFGPVYVQHSTVATDGVEGLRALAESLPPEFRYEPIRILADGDLVVTHGIYHGFGPDPLVAFDVWRVADGRIVEHWDSLTPVVSDTASGRSQTDGPTEPGDLERTEANRTLIEGFARDVLVGQDYSVLAQYISTDTYLQHNPEAADGLDGFGAAAAAWAEQGKTLDYLRVHQIVAEGDFVFTRAEGNFGVPVIYNDLWRVQDGRIVEHWDIIAEVPDDVPHGNGVF